jgi:hypothetical protein
MDKELLNNVQGIKDISSKDFAKKLKKSAKTNINGALLGGFVGVLIGIASKQNFYVTGIIGLVLGRLLIKSFTK